MRQLTDAAIQRNETGGDPVREAWKATGQIS